LAKHTTQLNVVLKSWISPPLQIAHVLLTYVSGVLRNGLVSFACFCPFLVIKKNLIKYEMMISNWCLVSNLCV